MSPSQRDESERAPDRTKLDISRGLLDPKHRVKLGEAMHLYLNLVDRKPRGSAWVFGRRLLQLSTLAAIEAVDVRTASTWLKRLEREGYVTVQRVPGYAKKAGIRIHISKPRDWIGGQVRYLIEQKPRPVPVKE